MTSKSAAGSKLIKESRSRPRGTEGSRLDRMENILTSKNGRNLVMAVNDAAHQMSGLLAYFARYTNLVSSYERGNKAKGLASQFTRKKTGLSGSKISPAMEELLELKKSFNEN